MGRLFSHRVCVWVDCLLTECLQGLNVCSHLSAWAGCLLTKCAWLTVYSQSVCMGWLFTHQVSAWVDSLLTQCRRRLYRTPLALWNINSSQSIMRCPCSPAGHNKLFTQGRNSVFCLGIDNRGVNGGGIGLGRTLRFSRRSTARHNIGKIRLDQRFFFITAAQSNCNDKEETTGRTIVQ